MFNDSLRDKPSADSGENACALDAQPQEKIGELLVFPYHQRPVNQQNLLHFQWKLCYIYIYNRATIGRSWCSGVFQDIT